MGAGGVSNRGKEVLIARKMEPFYKPNTIVDRLNPKTKKLMQRRLYDNKGRAIRNRDYSHSGDFPFPHDHTWNWSNGEGVRSQEHLPPDFDILK